MQAIALTYGNYQVTNQGYGLLIRQTRTGNEKFLQGDDAVMCHDELTDLFADHSEPNTRASRFSEAELAEQILGMYFV